MIINTARDAAALLEPHFASCEGEKLVAAHLDAERGLIRAIEQAGQADEVDLSIRAIIADALALGASGLIVAHNHPSGDPMPSEADLAATRALAATADSVGIRFHDHLIFGKSGDCRSFRALGLI
jgi:DNA repair protein RadC